MKKLLFTSIIIILLTSCASYTRIGEATVISTRNFDLSQKYELKQKYVTVKVSARKAKRLNVDMLTLAIDEACKQDPHGEFLQNAKIYIKSNGKKLKLEADIWGGL